MFPFHDQAQSRLRKVGIFSMAPYTAAVMFFLRRSSNYPSISSSRASASRMFSTARFASDRRTMKRRTGLSLFALHQWPFDARQRPAGMDHHPHVVARGRRRKRKGCWTPPRSTPRRKQPPSKSRSHEVEVVETNAAGHPSATRSRLRSALVARVDPFAKARSSSEVRIRRKSP